MRRPRPHPAAGLAAAALALVLGSGPAAAQVSGASIKAMLARASDRALDRLARPGAFSSDPAIRIALPGAGGRGVGELMELAGRAGLGGDLDGALNSAAERAAGQAKPIFRAAIDKVTFGDSVGILRGGDTGATDYLKRSTGDQVKARLLPLVTSALDASGALRQASRLEALGLDRGRLADYVAGKTSDGIFTYVGREESAARKDPVGTLGPVLKGLKF